MELLLIRHALPERVEGSSGPADPGLTDAGRQQAELLADYLASERIDAVYSSPMRRAVETAAPLAARLGVTPVVVEEVAEYDRHSNEYVPIEELKAAGDPRFYDPGLLAGVDPPHVFAERVVTAVERVVAAHPGAAAAIVCHGGVINAYLAAVLGLDVEPPGFFYPNYTSIHRVAAARSGERSILALNETAHLRHTGLPVGLFDTARAR